MQYDPKDLSIFVTGVVGRAMGAGTIGISRIGELTQAAVAAFEAHLAPKLAQAAPAPSPAPSASWGPQKPNWQAGVQAVASGAADIPAETKSFSIWGGDKSQIYGHAEVIWADLLGRAQKGDQEAVALLEKQAKASLGNDPKWHQANARRIGRAKACLAMLQGGAG